MSAFILSLFLILSWTGDIQKRNIYTGSTPANAVVKSFLEIPTADSIDFIRWKLTIQNNQYHLQCNYGIGQPNTNGFVNGGKKIEIKGQYEKVNKHYRLRHGTKVLKAIEVNTDLFHFLNQDNTLMIGNGGWSYTLNNTEPSGSPEISIQVAPTNLRDSIAFHGRTPCGVPGVIAPGKSCYKLKWYLILYPDKNSERSGTFTVSGTPWRQEGGKAGNWRIITGKQGQIIYRLTYRNGDNFLFLLKLDENILVFTDPSGKPLVGDADFSYTLNRR